MDLPELLLELYGRIGPIAEDVVDGLDAEQLATSPASGANTIGWLVWHIARVQDHHIAELLNDEQLWVTGDWADAWVSTATRTTRAMATPPRGWRPSARPTASC